VCAVALVVLIVLLGSARLTDQPDVALGENNPRPSAEGGRGGAPAVKAVGESGPVAVDHRLVIW
jgi:hypothetical protein